MDMGYLVRQFDVNEKRVKTFLLDDIITFSKGLDRRWYVVDVDFGTTPAYTFRCYKNTTNYELGLSSERYTAYDSRSPMYDVYLGEVER